MKRLLFVTALAVSLLASMLVPGIGNNPAQAQNAGSYNIDLFWHVEGCDTLEISNFTEAGPLVSSCSGSISLEDQFVLGVGDLRFDNGQPVTVIDTNMTWLVGNVGLGCPLTVSGSGVWSVCVTSGPFGKYQTYEGRESTVTMCIQAQAVNNSTPWGSTERCNAPEFATVAGSDAGWYMDEANNTRQWLTAQCRATLESFGTSFGVVRWSKIAQRPAATTQRTCNDIGGELGAECTVTVTTPGSVTVSWPDIGALGYNVSHDGQPAVWVQDVQWLDNQPGRNYRVVAWGNGTAGTVFECQGLYPPGSTGGFYTLPNTGAGWLLDGNTRQWISPSCRNDLEAAGKAFEIVDWAFMSQQPPSTTNVPCSALKLLNFSSFSCVAWDQGTVATVEWDDIGAQGYDVSVNGRAPVWVTGNSYSISYLAGPEYFKVTAWGNGTDGTSCTTGISLPTT